MSAPTSGQAAGTAWWAAFDAGLEDPECWDAAAGAALKASPEIATARRFCRVLLAQAQPGALTEAASAVLGYLDGTPMASPETSAGVIARIPSSEGKGTPGD